MHSEDRKILEKENHNASNLNTYCKIHPYIGLRGKLSLSWIAYPIVSLIFVMLRLFIAMNSIDPIVEDIRQRAIRSCDALELATSTVTSLPHFMAGTFNSATAETINLTIRGFARTLDLSIQAVNGIIVFFINIYKSTYRCFLELAVRGSISAISEGVKFLQDFSTNTLNGIKSSIDGAINDFNSALNGVRDAIPDLPGIPDIPTLSIPAVNDLSTFTLPNTGVVQGLDALNEGIPTMDEIEKKLTDLVTIPFNELRAIINNSTADLRFNSTVLPVPEKNNIKFCEENLDLHVLDDIKTDLRKAAWVGLAVLFVLCFLIILANAFYTFISHKRFMRHVKNSVETFSMTSSHTNKNDAILDIIKISEHPILSRPIIRTSNYFKSDENRILYRWFWDYVLHQPAIVCFIIGLSGIIAIYIQLMIIDGVRRGHQDEINDSISNFGNAVMNLMNSQLQGASREYSTQTNQVISNLENDINQNLFGWVNTTTTTLNNTLNTAVDEMVGFVQTTFGGAPFIGAAVQELLNCLILVKIQGIQAGLTFIRDNAFLGLPRVNETALTVSPALMNSVVSEATTRLTGDPNEDGTGGQIGRLFDAYEDRLRSELPLFVTLISCWLLVFIFGLIRVIWFKFHQRKYLKNQG